MKKMLSLAAIAAVALTGCSKSETIGEGPAQTKAISFETHVTKNTKGAPIIGTTFPTTTKFGVYSFKTDAAAWAESGVPAGTVKMENTEVSYGGSAWSYANPQYWVAGANYTFLAYAPYKASSGFDEAKGELAYTVPTAFASQEDLLYSIAKDQSWAGGDAAATVVGLPFKHALSQVKFSVKTKADYSADYTVTLKSIQIKGISSVGSLNLTTDAWSGQGTPETYSVTVANGALSATNVVTDPLMLLPQTGTDIEVVMTMDITVPEGGNGDADFAGMDKTFTTKISNVAWVAGKIFNYASDLELDNILNRKPISFDPTLPTDWTASN